MKWSEHAAKIQDDTYDICWYVIVHCASKHNHHNTLSISLNILLSVKRIKFESFVIFPKLIRKSTIHCMIHNCVQHITSCILSIEIESIA